MRVFFNLLKTLLMASVFMSNFVHSHELSLAEMNMYEFKPGSFQWTWATPPKDRPLSEVLKIQWPEGCVSDEQVVQCTGDKGLAGTLEVQGLGQSYSAVMFNIKWRDGIVKVYTLTSAQPRIQLFGGPNDEREGLEIAKAYTSLGFEHILTGWDHLCFVLGLLLLVGFKRRLISTITFFTIAHSITLALSALDVISLRSAPVEASIALSIMLVCYEALKDKNTLTHRWPEVVAFSFGLLHGMGFASALKEIGLPSENIFMALLTFNAGVEIGQLFVILVTWILSIIWIKFIRSTFDLRTPILFAIGGFSMFWSIGRFIKIFA
jgi:hydrogenase/urease accessory protein HupE